MTHTATHTPGPWVAALGERLNTDVYCTDVQGNRIFIAEFATQADAVLGAAAPAMYALLQDATLQLSRLTGSNLEAYARTFAVLAQKALAQAEGR
jgi:hypothetical protein